jgi:hypothetical protein
MHRYHGQQPDYRASYRAAKEIWSRAGELRDALRAGPVETETLVQQMAQMNETFAQLDKSLSKWGDGDRSLTPLNDGRGPRTVVTPGVEVDVPFVGGPVGSPHIVTDDGPALERLKLHPNSPGSRRVSNGIGRGEGRFELPQEDAGMAADPIRPPRRLATTGPSAATRSRHAAGDPKRSSCRRRKPSPTLPRKHRFAPRRRVRIQTPHFRQSHAKHLSQSDSSRFRDLVPKPRKPLFVPSTHVILPWYDTVATASSFRLRSICRGRGDGSVRERCGPEP